MYRKEVNPIHRLSPITCPRVEGEKSPCSCELIWRPVLQLEESSPFRTPPHTSRGISFSQALVRSRHLPLYLGGQELNLNLPVVACLLEKGMRYTGRLAIGRPPMPDYSQGEGSSRRLCPKTQCLGQKMPWLGFEPRFSRLFRSSGIANYTYQDLLRLKSAKYAILENQALAVKSC